MSTANVSQRFIIMTCVIVSVAACWVTPSQCAQRPHLRRQGSAVQLIVEDNPFLILGGELGNSSTSNLDYMKSQWYKLVKLNLNTVLAPVCWDLIEPQESAFDFTLVDRLIRGARSHNLRLVLLWFASFKNSMSCYAPVWVKTNQQRFPRARNKESRGMEILTVFRDENWTADARAFAALMRHLRQVDGEKHIVIMAQVENEIGMIPEARDYSNLANDLFGKPVPKELMDHQTQQVELGNYTLKVSHDYTWSWSSGPGESGRWPRAGGFFISTGSDEYIIAGTGIIVTFAPNSPGDPIAGIASIQEGRYVEGQWAPGRWMNGDQSHQGRHLRIPANSFGIQRIKLYRYH